MTVEDLLDRALQLLQAGEHAAAEACAMEAIGLDPGQAPSWCCLGQVLRQAGRLGDAVVAYERAAALDPGDVGYRTNLGNIFRNMSLPEAAIHWHGEALALRPDDLILNCNYLFVLPIVATSTQQIEQLRQRCLNGLWRLEQRGQILEFGDYAMSHHPYYLIYHNHDDRAVLEAYGRLFRRHLRSVELPPWTPRLPRDRRRIGFLSGFFYAHSNSRAFEGLIRYLDRRRFEVVVIHLASSHADAIRDRIDACADQALVLDGSVEGAARQLDDLGLDLLFFTDIGMHPTAMLLACHRSAPVQVTGWGVPQTSGLATIDHYISGDLVESPRADRQYSENLVRLPGLPCCYLAENLEPAIHGRDYFFLPQDAPLFGCLQSFSKLHPDFDGVLEQIAQRVPQAWFVFVEAEVTSYTQVFLERISQSAPTLAGRLILLSRMGRQEFISLAACLDLLLDPPYFGSGVTLYESIHTGTPIVTLEGEFLRSRFVAGAYRLMGLERAPVARSFDAYIDWAVTLMADSEGLASLRRTIADRAAEYLYDRRDVVDAFADFAEEAIAKATGGAA
ncbi:MAG: tetratricopeptide repeat protein [Cyanobium sp.]